MFLKRIKEYEQEWFPSPRIISQGDVSQPSSINAPSTMPTASFISPFLGKSVSELNTIFTKSFATQNAFLPRVFLVLDKRTIDENIEWASCQLIRGGEAFDEKEEKNFVRVDFYLNMQLASMLELGDLNLDESPHDPEKVMGVHNMSNY